MLANGLGQLAEGAEATARCPTTPPVEVQLRQPGVPGWRNSLEALTQAHRSTKFGVLATEIFTLLLMLLAQIPNIAAQAPQRPFEI